MKTALVAGAGGFIGSHMVKRLKKDGYWVRGVDLKYPEYSPTEADEFIIGDLRDERLVSGIMKPIEVLNGIIHNKPFDLVFQFAADMGGMGYLAGGGNDADVMHNSGVINYHVAYWAAKNKVGKLFYSSSACVYPLELQETTDNKGLKESDAIPAHPDLCYGWEKLNSEILYDAFHRNYGLDIRIARFHNIFGIEGTYDGERAKAPASISRKVAIASDGDEIEVWGEGTATRSFLIIDECIEGVLRLMDSDFKEAINIGSDEMVSINELTKMVIKISGKKLTIKNVPSDKVGVTGRNSNNDLIKEKLNWSPTQKLEVGMRQLYSWIEKQVTAKEFKQDLKSI